jgi:hypothetical protein
MKPHYRAMLEDTGFVEWIADGQNDLREDVKFISSFPASQVM